MKNKEVEKCKEELKVLKDLIFEDGASEAENLIEHSRREALTLALKLIDNAEHYKQALERIAKGKYTMERDRDIAKTALEGGK